MSDRLQTKDLDMLRTRGIDADEAQRQFALLDAPPPPADLDRPATLGDGIVELSGQDLTSWMEAGARAVQAGRLLRFVPASGAATRMFKELLQALPPDPVADAHGDETPALHEYRQRHTDFAFWAQLQEQLHAARFDPEAVGSVEGARASLRWLLQTDPDGHGLGLAARPKGLIPFHGRADSARTPVEEHLYEAAALYDVAGGEERDVRAHFTVGSTHAPPFEALVEEVTPRLETETGASFDVSFSTQAPSTDTLALTPDGQLVRDEAGQPLLRPGGHGALIYNLEQVGGDLVTIKNIDNVLPRGRQQQVVETKLALVGIVALTQARLHRHLQALHEAPSAETAGSAEEFAAETLSIPPLPDDLTLEERCRQLKHRLDRPLRACGVVLNAGEPGGGPFWVRGREGYPRLQIVETSQIDTTDAAQARILAAATHFNPVDLVCAMRDWRGEPYPLERFVEERASFVTAKSVGGTDLRALERPGLWNGAMDGWHTLFIEVPSETFAPVKTVFDLLRPEHQAD